MEDTKRTLLIGTDLFRSPNAHGVTDFPGVTAKNNNGLIEFITQAQNDFDIVFVADDVAKKNNAFRH